MYLNKIRNIKSIEELSKHYDLIRKYAHSLNRENTSKMDDIIQEVFIKINEIFITQPGKIINGSYVSLTFRSILSNEHKKKKIKTYTEPFDLEQYLDNEDDYDYEYTDEQNKIYDELDSIVDTFSWYEKKVYEYSLQMSISELSRQSDISHRSLRFTLSKIKEKIKIGLESKFKK